MSATELQQIESSIKASDELIVVGKCLERLYNNRDFIKVIKEGYFEKEAIRLVHLKADPDRQTEQSQKSIVSQMDAIGNLSQYLNTLQFKVGMAYKAKASDEEMRDELLAEGL